MKRPRSERYFIKEVRDAFRQLDTESIAILQRCSSWNQQIIETELNPLVLMLNSNIAKDKKKEFYSIMSSVRWSYNYIYDLQYKKFMKKKRLYFYLLLDKLGFKDADEEQIKLIEQCVLYLFHNLKYGFIYYPPNDGVYADISTAEIEGYLHRHEKQHMLDINKTLDSYANLLESIVLNGKVPFAFIWYVGSFLFYSDCTRCYGLYVRMATEDRKWLGCELIEQVFDLYYTYNYSEEYEEHRINSALDVVVSIIEYETDVDLKSKYVCLLWDTVRNKVYNVNRCRNEYLVDKIMVTLERVCQPGLIDERILWPNGYMLVEREMLTTVHISKYNRTIYKIIPKMPDLSNDDIIEFVGHKCCELLLLKSVYTETLEMYDLVLLLVKTFELDDYTKANMFILSLFQLNRWKKLYRDGMIDTTIKYSFWQRLLSFIKSMTRFDHFAIRDRIFLNTQILSVMIKENIIKCNKIVKTVFLRSVKEHMFPSRVYDYKDLQLEVLSYL